MTLRSAQFDDIYFSPEDGWAETRHVFLDGNNLPQAWHAAEAFTIAETGFGTGLNFLAAACLFEETRTPHQRLNYISFEKSPLTSEQIQTALSDLLPKPAQNMLHRMLQQYPLTIPGWYPLFVTPSIHLMLVFGDVNKELPRLNAPVHAWFLDGFAPAKNPEMWTKALFKNMARLALSETRFATFTAAGAVKRGLEEYGFHVEKAPGFGRKRDMLSGWFKGSASITPRPSKPRPGNVAIIGGGMAGTACARALQQVEINSTLFEASESLAAGASGNPVGLFNPRFYAQKTDEAYFYASAFSLATSTFSRLEHIDYSAHGSLHLITSGEKEKRFKNMAQNWGWPAEHMRLLTPEQASQTAGIELKHHGLFLPDSGTVSPAKLCNEYARNVEVRCNTPVQELRKDGEVWQIGEQTYDAVIICAGSQAQQLDQLYDFPLETVRGQILEMQATETSRPLTCNLNFSGYLTPARNGRHVAGATFQRWLDHTDVQDEDNQEILTRLFEAVPSLHSSYRVTDARASLRSASKDRLPVIGPLNANSETDIQAPYVSLAHGSHGLVTSLMAAHMLVGQMVGAPPPPFAANLDPQRFERRALRKTRKKS